jgi:polyhydroxybutyrate depolymerase
MRVKATDETVRMWIEHNGLADTPVFIRLPDKDATDDAAVERYEWSDSEKNLTVLLYKIVGGGHAYPGGRQYLSKRIVGNTCRDIHATEEIWNFFSRHQKK